MSVKDLQAVKEKKYPTISLNGKDRKLKYGMRAWAAIEEEYGNITTVFDLLKTNPFSTIPKLIYFGIIREKGEVFTQENVLDWLDEYDFSKLKAITNILKEALVGSIPAPKETKNPKKAK